MLRAKSCCTVQYSSSWSLINNLLLGQSAASESSWMAASWRVGSPHGLVIHYALVMKYPNVSLGISKGVANETLFTSGVLCPAVSTLQSKKDSDRLE